MKCKTFVVPCILMLAIMPNGLIKAFYCFSKFFQFDKQVAFVVRPIFKNWVKEKDFIKAFYCFFILFEFV
uniref:Uncharacterized protein n=1 Tax=Arcella intermedia TaxID=1963864 RepID=A0A6B2LU48_9EUKA